LDTEKLNIKIKISSSYLNDKRIKEISEKLKDAIHSVASELDKETYPITIDIEIKNQ
jgi:hypothetical protein